MQKSCRCTCQAHAYLSMITLVLALLLTVSNAQLVFTPQDPDAGFLPDNSSSNSNSSSGSDNATMIQPSSPLPSPNPKNSTLDSPHPDQIPDTLNPDLAISLWQNPDLPISERVADLISKMTLPEKLGLMAHGQQAIPRLAVPAYNFWTECLHGHQEQGSGALPTIFPQPIVLASTWDESLAHKVFAAISDELRAKDNAEYNKSGRRRGLICWTPHVNIFRDPRWGRGSETFGEDPYLTARLALQVVRGLQGEDRRYAKVVATCKHFLGYSLEGAEGVSRYSHNIKLSPQDMTDTELPPFQACVQAAGGHGIMCSYNAVNGTPSCANDAAINGLLRQGLGFGGYVVADCNAVAALTWGHQSHSSLAEASAAALKSGVDIFCDRTDGLVDAVSGGLVLEADIDAAVNRTLTMRFLTGQFDPPDFNPWQSLNISTANSRSNRALAREVVQKGTVLLKNTPPVGNGRPILPLVKADLQKLCVTGPLSNSVEHMMGNYYGKFDAAAAATPLKGIQEELAGSGVVVEHSYGMDILGQIHYDWPLESALQACENADAAIIVIGSSMIENDKDPATGSYRPATEGEGLDRINLAVPGRQGDLVKAIAGRAPGLPIIVVIMHGGGLDVGWLRDIEAVNAIVAVGFPGQEGGRGLADVLFGNVNPSARLPITWYHNNYTDAISPLALSMRPQRRHGRLGRSYRFLDDQSYVLYPFGFGLSYTTFSYSVPTVVQAGQGSCAAADADDAQIAYCVSLSVINTGHVAGEHVVPLYLSHVDTAGVNGNPLQSLRAFKRTQLLTPGQAETLAFRLTLHDFVMPRESDGRNMLHLGLWKFSLGTFDAPITQPAGFSYSGFVSSGLSKGKSWFSSSVSSGVWGSELGLGLGGASGVAVDSEVGVAVVFDIMLPSS